MEPDRRHFLPGGYSIRLCPMRFHSPGAHIFVPDSLEPQAALPRTTHIGIGAHQDDLEIMAIDGILRCFAQTDPRFTGVVVTDGRGSLPTFFLFPLGVEILCQLSPRDNHDKETNACLTYPRHYSRCAAGGSEYRKARNHG